MSERLVYRLAINCRFGYVNSCFKLISAMWDYAYNCITET